MPSSVIDRDVKTAATSERRPRGSTHGSGGPLERLTVNLIARASRPFGRCHWRVGR
jgi:hypothetical protein